MTMLYRPVTAVLCAALLALPVLSLGQENKQDFSPAEKLLFMSNQMGGIKPPSTINYTFRKSGSLEEAFEDKVALSLDKTTDGKCCSAHTEFLSGARQLPSAEMPVAEGNPVLLNFLERDLNEMKRLTKGSTNHFRKYIRMAAYKGATVRDASFTYKGKPVAGKEITLTPYLEDPNRPKYEKFVRKTYQFVLCEAVPGGVFAVRTQIPGDTDGQPPLITEELLIEGAAPSAPNLIK
jgi:hypothetical protein